MSDIALSKNGMMFVTQEGEGFTGVWAGEYRKYGEKKGRRLQKQVVFFTLFTLFNKKIIHFFVNDLPYTVYETLLFMLFII